MENVEVISLWPGIKVSEERLSVPVAGKQEYRAY